MRYKKLIEIDIDLLTQCLIRTKDNKTVKTEVKEINTQHYNFKDWEFNWVEESKKRNKILGLFAENDKRLQGIVEYYENKERQLLEVVLVEIAPFNNRHNPKNFLKSKEYLGVGGHLFAEIARISFEKGYDGYVSFLAKTNLIEHYKKILGAKQLSYIEMYIDDEAAMKLVKKYYGKY